jgi:hypothetical protein
LQATGPLGAHGQATILLIVGGAPSSDGQELIDYVLSLPSRLLGSPLSFPPSVPNMIAANPCDVNGIVSNGGLAAAYSEAGPITVLKYPSPSYYDQVCWLSMQGNAKGFGAIDDMGVFAGVSVQIGSLQTTSWFRDATWTHQQSYLSPDSAVLVTVYESASLGLRVTQKSFVHPTEDFLADHFEIERLPGSPVADQAQLLYYENLSPCCAKIPFAPVLDVYGDLLNDFACAYHSGDDALVHFKPENANYFKLAAFSSAPHPDLQADTDAWIDSLTTTFGPGVYFAIGSDAPSSGHQVGQDTGDVPAPASAVDRCAYAECCSGSLTGNPIAYVQANGALSRAIDLSQGNVPATFYIAAGQLPDGPKGARTNLQTARASAFAVHLAAVEQDWQTWLSGARLPNPPADAQTVAVAKRSLIVVRESTDRNTGAIVASIATQLPYGEDWPRDGAFINYALDVAGYPDMVTKHNIFYSSVQRSTGLFAGTFDMNFYADGVPGGPIPLEIDEASFGVWTMSAHAAFISSATERAAYLAQVYPAIKRGADFVAGWRNPITGLQLPANEDDNLAFTASLHGATAILTALDAALVAGNDVNESPAVLQAWQGRRDELAAAIQRTYWYPPVQAYYDPGGTGNPVGPAVQPSAWLVWPAQILPYSDPTIQSTCDFLFQALEQVVQQQVTESAYDGKTTLALAQAWQGDPTKIAQLRTAFATFTHDLPTDGTLHVGEFYKLGKRNGVTRWTSENDVPHVWEHMLIYHTAVTLYP